MRIVIADDSRQRNPSRERMGPMVCTGGLIIPAANVSLLEKALEEVCNQTGFPKNEPFKWSPGRELWMRANLIEEERKTFFISILEKIQQSQASAIVVAEDTTCRVADRQGSHEIDTVVLFIERVQRLLARHGEEAFIIVDRPGGNRRDEELFLLNCLETLQRGTNYVKPENIIINVLSSPSKFIRLLQAADLIASCTLATICGETNYSHDIFDKIRPILAGGAGYGLKIHPDFKYVNLYHWILNEEYYWRFNVGHPLPMRGRPYSSNQMQY